MRANGDFERLNLSGKLYFTPSDKTEIMVSGGTYRSEYGMPPALFTQRARYWRFPKWDRSTLSAGGFTSLGGDAVLRFRGFYVDYDNTLDWFADPAMAELDSSSTYDNSSYGGFVLAEVPAGERNTVKASLLYQKDIARIQDDAGLPRDRYDQGTLSAGVEDEFRLTDRWKVIGGLSLDHITKFQGGENNTKLNPLIGVKFTPNDELDFHVSFARKSRFPSHAFPLFDELGESGPPGRVGDELRVRRDLERAGLPDGDRLLQPVQGLHRHHHLGGRNAAVRQRRRSPHHRFRGPGPEEAQMAGSDRQLHVPRPAERHRRQAARRPAQEQPQFRPLGPAGQGRPGRGLRAAGIEVLVVEHADESRHAAGDPVVLQPGRHRQLRIPGAHPGLHEARQHLRPLLLHRARLSLAGRYFEVGLRLDVLK
ncbi:MAG: TonB-dependent receptor [Desulfobacterales bacterium]|nr:TonB-dependent receptor [Desulfobacterales bacterium]